MPKLPVVSGKETVRKLQKIGYTISRQKGSHVRMHSPHAKHRPISVPMHTFLKPGLFHQILKDADLSIEEFINL